MRRAGMGEESESCLDSDAGLTPMPAFCVVPEGRRFQLEFGDNRDEDEDECWSGIDSFSQTKAVREAMKKQRWKPE